MPISSHRGDGISSNSEKIDIVVQNIGLHACAQMSRRTYHHDTDDLKISRSRFLLHEKPIAYCQFL